MINMNRSVKPLLEKENQQKHVNKKTDILTSLQNIKLPLQKSLSYNENYQSVQIITSIPSTSQYCNSARNPILSLVDYEETKLSDTEEYCHLYQK